MGKPDIRPRWQVNHWCSSCLPFIVIFSRLSKEKFQGAKVERLFLESSSKAGLDQQAGRTIVSKQYTAAGCTKAPFCLSCFPILFLPSTFSKFLTWPPRTTTAPNQEDDGALHVLWGKPENEQHSHCTGLWLLLLYFPTLSAACDTRISTNVFLHLLYLSSCIHLLSQRCTSFPMPIHPADRRKGAKTIRGHARWKQSTHRSWLKFPARAMTHCGPWKANGQSWPGHLQRCTEILGYSWGQRGDLQQMRASRRC